MSASDDQTVSRQPSEAPSLQGADDLSLAIEPSIDTLSISQLPEEVHHHVSWSLYLASITPLICGGLGPTLTLLALSGCADRWRVATIDGLLIEDPDPKWVTITTSVAVAIGLVANIFLLMRMLGRGNPKHMQWLCIILWFLECLSPPRPRFWLALLNSPVLAVMNFATVGVFVRIVGDGSPFAYAQGFWMTVCSAAMSTVCSALMAINSFFLPHWGKRGKMGLSGPQRVFVVQIMVFIFWLAMYVPNFHLPSNFIDEPVELLYSLQRTTFPSRRASILSMSLSPL
jgi:hypothetical protein